MQPLQSPYPGDGTDPSVNPEWPDGVSPDEFKAAFRRHPSGVAVVTADSVDGPVALTVSSVFSVSTEPPLLVFSLAASSSSAPAICAAETVVVHLVSTANLELARLCATSGADRFADTSAWSRLASGEPLFHDVPVWVRGRIVNLVGAGNSNLIVVHALQTSQLADAASPMSGDPTSAPATDALVYHNRSWHTLSERSLIG